MDITACYTATGATCVAELSEEETVTTLLAKLLRLLPDAARRDAEGGPLELRARGCDAPLGPGAAKVQDTGLQAGGEVDVVAVGPAIRAPFRYAVQASAIAVSPCGTRVAFGGRGARTVSVWNTETGEQVWTADCGGQSDYIAAARFSPCGKTLATTRGVQALLWCADTGTLLHTLPDAAENITTLAFTPSGLLVTGGGRYTVWDASTQQPLAKSSTGGLTAVGASDDYVVAAYDDGALRVSAVGNPEPLCSDVGSSDLVYSVSVCSNGVVVHPVGTRLRVWRASSAELLREIDTGRRVDMMSCSEQRGYVASRGAHAPEPQFWEVDTGRQIVVEAAVHGCDRAYGMALSPCGRWLFQAGNDHVSVMAVKPRS